MCEVVMGCSLELNRLSTTAHLNFFPLGLYDALIGMDWLEQHRDKEDCFNKVL